MAKRFLKTAVVSALFALTLAVSASAASAGGATTTTAVNFRTGAGTNYGIISTLPAGTHVVVSTRSSGGWATVVYIVLQAAYLIWKWRREHRNGK